MMPAGAVMLLWGLLAATPPLGPAPAAGAGATSVPTLTVLNFVDRAMGDDWAWLEKGLADMLTTDLSASAQLRLVERERMQALLDEQHLTAIGLTDEKTAARLGQFLKADLALFGSYLIEDGQVHLEAHVVRVASGQLERVEVISGPAEQVLQLEKTLAERVLAKLNVPLTEAERSQLQQYATLMVDAAACYYRAMGRYDAGEYFDALGLCQLAVRKDSQYVLARFRVAQIFYMLGESEHAMLEFQRVASRRESPYAPGSAYYAARIKDQRLGLPAAEDYLAVAQTFPESIPAIMAGREAGSLFQVAGDDRAYDAYLAAEEAMNACAIKAAETGGDRFRDIVLQMGLTNENKHALSSLTRERYWAYLVMWASQGRIPKRLPANVLYLAQDSKPTRVDDLKAGTPPEKFPLLNRKLHYLLLPPSGKVFKTLQVTLRLGPPSEAEPWMPPAHCSVHVYSPWPAYRDMSRRETLGGERYGGKTVPVAEPYESVVKVDIPQNAHALWLQFDDGPGLLIDNFSVQAEYSDAPELTMADLPLEWKRLLQPPSTSPLGSAHGLSACVVEGVVNTVFGDQPLDGFGFRNNVRGASKLWFARYLPDGVAHGWPEEFEFNSTNDDYHPSLAHGPSKSLWLAFASRRDLSPDGGIYLCSAADGKHWSVPRRIDLGFTPEELRPAEFQEPYREILARFAWLRLVVDSQGVYWLAFVLQNAGDNSGVYITNSHDTVHWRKPVKLANGIRADPEGVGLCLCSGANGALHVLLQADELVLAKVNEDLAFSKDPFARGVRPPFAKEYMATYGLHLLSRPNEELLLVFQKKEVQSRPGGGMHYFSNRDLYLSTSKDSRNWETYRLQWTPSSYGAACMDGDTLILCGAGGCRSFNLSTELTEANRVEPFGPINDDSQSAAGEQEVSVTSQPN